MKTETPNTRYWRSLEELERTDEFKDFAFREFPEGADKLDGVDRRRFLQLMGASTALAGASSCRWEKTNILPLAERPEDRIPGVPEHFATAMELGAAAQGLVLTSYDGRPIKVEGNDQLPGTQGAASCFAQGAILELYDPDRSRVLTRDGNEQKGWAPFDAWFDQELSRLEAKSGAGLAILHQPTSSETAKRLVAKVKARFPQARVAAYAPVDRATERAGGELAFGRPVRTHFRLDGAKVIATFDGDLFSGHPDELRHARDFAKHRRPEEGWMTRLYSVESRFTSTGSLADHRLPVRSESVGAVLAALEATLIAKGATVPSGWGSPSAAPSGALLDAPRTKKFVDALANDLLAHRGECVIQVGAGQTAPVHAVAHRINAMLGAIGKTVVLTDEPVVSGTAELEALVAAMRGRQVETLFVLGGNPVYDAPADLDFEAALGEVGSVAHLALYADETSAASTWHLPQAHFLESWGDARAWDGTHCLTQPLIHPLYKGRTALELLARMGGELFADSQELVRATFDERYATDDSGWRRALHDGFVAQSAFGAITPAGRGFAAPSFPPSALAAGIPANGSLELTLFPDASTYDGRYANNGWLQELPEFMTKLTWDNAALIGPATAKSLGVKHEQLVELEIDGRKLECAVYVMPGQAAGAVGLALGYGRTRAGHVGGLIDEDAPSVGFNSYRLATSAAGWSATGLTVKKTGRTYKLASTQDHQDIDTTGLVEREARIEDLARHQTLEQYTEHPDAMQQTLLGTHYPPLQSLWKEFEYAGNRWGMSIDLSTCTGCNACVIACQSENNIPIVGKEQVINNREMHWLRIDRYFETGEAEEHSYAPHESAKPVEHRSHGELDEDNPRVHRQPVGCIQCEMAPCEQVCPVAATVHSDEGLNDMVYNRCIGTRYCSNNCPVKVRRFNFFNYHKDLKDPDNAVKKLGFNPEVTVRHRGVMEKCTYCVQRIQAVKIDARNKKRPIEDGEIVTACQQTCPAEAITFGDLADEKSAVRKKHELPRGYAMLAYLNIKPRTAYLARVTNPNPELV
ncbi:TAT-variant-translocated molybdopterin oxidoreductase [Engelhardtia mirabilis]|uniref:Anaerobic dimethyl sulfoxide reductase chain B n=1 Tax=Engelhardtia mirabilis TaxID=2528011 RepID=A0A518BH02_9BACT|nr:Anaerobic dimethyl sulfoxide reductase chain B [Planctomycetes bacterium Pla133]QDV00594.1 Anaerobic dimethyl sulfoxide reductase chain B [Planctomycetes bacterium Pla86]